MSLTKYDLSKVVNIYIRDKFESDEYVYFEERTYWWFGTKVKTEGFYYKYDGDKVGQGRLANHTLEFSYNDKKVYEKAMLCLSFIDGNKISLYGEFKDLLKDYNSFQFKHLLEINNTELKEFPWSNKIYTLNLNNNV